MQRITSPKALLLTLMFTVCLAQAHEPATLQICQVTIENLSCGLALTPPLVVTHDDIQLSYVGEAASPALQAIAENDVIHCHASTQGGNDLLNVHAGNFDAFVAALRQGQLYVNVHTADFGAGAIRGQIGVAASAAHPLGH